MAGPAGADPSGNGNGGGSGKSNGKRATFAVEGQGFTDLEAGELPCQRWSQRLTTRTDPDLDRTCRRSDGYQSVKQSGTAWHPGRGSYRGLVAQEPLLLFAQKESVPLLPPS